jgi:flagellar basal body-associated protein FliL
MDEAFRPVPLLATSDSSSVMGKFLKENWIWIVAPIVLVAVGVLVLVFFVGGDEGTAPFTYALF